MAASKTSQKENANCTVYWKQSCCTQFNLRWSHSDESESDGYVTEILHLQPRNNLIRDEKAAALRNDRNFKALRKLGKIEITSGDNGVPCAGPDLDEPKMISIIENSGNLDDLNYYLASDVRPAVRVAIEKQLAKIKKTTGKE